MARPRLFGPLLRYELLTSARRARYYALRCGYVAALGFVLWIAYQVAVGGGGGATSMAAIRANAAVGTNFAAAFGYVQLAAALLLAVAVLAPALTAEKERRTIDYLLTTDLTDRELVFGKYAARLLLACLPVVAGMGLLGICQIFGGLDAEELVALTALTLGAMASVGALALLVSVQTARTRDALLAAYVLAALLFGLPHVLRFALDYWRGLNAGIPAGGLPSWFAPLDAAAERWRWAEPFHVVFRRSEGKSRLGAWPDLQYFAAVHAGVAAGCLALAWLTVRSRRRKELAGAGAAGPARKWWRRRFGPRVPLGWLPPVAWKEYCFGQALAFWPSLLFGVCSFGWLFASAVQLGLGNDPSLRLHLRDAWNAGATALGVWTTLAVAIRAGTAVPTEVAQDTWAFLLATTLRPSAIMLGKAIGALRPLVLYGGFLLVGACAAAVGDIEALPNAALAFAATAGVSVFFAGVGLWIGAAAQKTSTALLGTLSAFGIVQGVGQLAVALAAGLLALAVQTGLDLSACVSAWTMSMPGALLWQVAGTGNDEFRGAARGWMVAYPLLGLLALGASIRHFPALSGRNEGDFAAPSAP